MVILKCFTSKVSMWLAEKLPEMVIKCAELLTIVTTRLGETVFRYSNKRKYLLSYPKGYVIPINNMTVKRVLYSLLSNCFEGFRSMKHKVVALIVQVNILDQNLALMSHNKLLYSPQGD